MNFIKTDSNVTVRLADGTSFVAYHLIVADETDSVLPDKVGMASGHLTHMDITINAFTNNLQDGIK